MSSTSGSTAPSRAIFWYAVAYVLIFTPHLQGTIFPPTAFYYNLDERIVVYSTIDRFFGLPSTCLMWPSTTIQLASLPVYLLDMLIRLGCPRGAAAGLQELATYLSLASRDPRHLVTITRVIVLGISSTAPLFAYNLARRLQVSVWLAISLAE